MTGYTRRIPKSYWWSAGSVLLMIIGAFGPWAKVAELVTINGTDGGRDGWIVVGAAGVASVALLLYLRFRRSWLVVLSLLAGLAAAATAAYDISDIRATASDDLLFGGLVHTQWGIYAALIGSISLGLASLGVLLEGRRGDDGGVTAKAPAGA